MMEERALVVSIDGEQAFVEIQRDQPCALCGASQGCGISLWSRIFAKRRASFSTQNKLNAKVGERIIIGVEEGALLTGSLLGANLADSQSAKDLYAALGALLGLILGLLLVRLYTAQSAGGRYRPVMLRRA
jgi:sigma-E factor negative regulatory protein RseC